MSRFLRIGQELTKIYVEGRDIEEFNITKAFLDNILSKDKLYKSIDIKTDMRQKCLKNKEYIHSMNYWKQYLKYLEKELCQI